MDVETRAKMQHRDSVDTLEIQTLKRHWWNVQAIVRDYPRLAGEVNPLAETLELLVDVYTAYATEHGLKPINQTHPRIPLPADNEGKFSNGKALSQILADSRKAENHYGVVRI